MSPFRADAAAHPESLESRYADRVWLRTSAIALAIGVTLVACGSAYSEAQLPASNGDGGGADGGASDAAADAVPRDAPDDATVLEASFADVTQIAANETHAFVAYRDGVARCSADGSCERNALTSSGVRAIAVDAVGTLFVASDSAILRCGGAPFGCAAERAAIDAMKTVPAANLVVLDGMFVWTSASSSSLFRLPRGPGEPAPVARANDRAAAPIAAFGPTRAAFATNESVSTIDEGGVVALVLTGIVKPAAVATSESVIAVLTNDRAKLIVTRLEGAANSAMTLPTSEATALAASGASVYWTRPSAGEVLRATHPDAIAVKVKTGLSSPRLVAASKSRVWFTTIRNDGTGLSTLSSVVP